MTKCTIATAAELILEYIAKDEAAMLWGPPGVGKSEVIDQVATKLGIPVIDFRASLRDPVDLRGLPFIDGKEGTTRWLPPSELPNVKKHGPRGILKLDEINVASQAMQAACFGLVLERRLGEYILPKGWVPIAAGNRMADRAAAQRMPTALRSRFGHLEVEPDLNAWCNWANVNNISPMIVAFLRWRPHLLHVMPTGEENSFPTPRTWMKANKFIDCSKATRVHLISSLVGDGPGGELEGFIGMYQHLPDIKQIEREPMKAKVPPTSEPSAMWAVATAIARHATSANIGNFLKYADRLPREHAVLVGLDATVRDPSLKVTKAYADWAINYQDLLN